MTEKAFERVFEECEDWQQSGNNYSVEVRTGARNYCVDLKTFVDYGRMEYRDQRHPECICWEREGFIAISLEDVEAIRIKPIEV